MFARAQHHVVQRPLVSSWHSTTIDLPPPQYPPIKLTERKVKLPVKPGVPTGPRVYVTNKEYNQYIRPLFWYRWGLKFFNRDLYLKDGELCAGAFNSPYLKRDMHFIGAENTKWFMSRLSRICRASGQEPFLCIRKVNYGSNDSFRVSVMSCTPRCEDAPSLLTKDGTRIGPGISLHDARFAIVLEKSFYNFLCAKRGFDTPWKRLEIPEHVDMIKAMQRDEDRALNKRELGRKEFVQTPSLEDVIPHPLPEPPSCVSNEPCTDQDFEETIVPLYSRGWYVVYNNVTVGIKEKRKLEKQPVLNGFFRFTSFPVAMQFSRDLLDLAEAEKITLSLWLDAQTVTVQGISEVDGIMVMRRDARFAVLVEQLFEDHYSRHARHSWVRAMKFLAQPNTVEELIAHPAARSKRTYMWNKWENILKRKQGESGASVTVTEE